MVGNLLPVLPGVIQVVRWTWESNKVGSVWNWPGRSLKEMDEDRLDETRLGFNIDSSSTPCSYVPEANMGQWSNHSVD